MMELLQGTEGSRILIVVVLYKELPAESEAVRAVFHFAKENPAVGAQFRLLLYDNSPEAQPVLPTSIPVEYLHDRTNPGLAVAYNHALRRATELQLDWLLLLDQDAGVTGEYLVEAARLTKLHAGEARIAAFVPFLIGVKGPQSPGLTFLDMVRRQITFRNRRPLVAPKDAFGLQEQRFTAFNSGAVLRVSAVHAVGGFPEEYWLDFLDIAVFHALHDKGYRLFFMKARLIHALSVDSKDFYLRDDAFARHSNILHAMSLYICQYGTRLDRWLNRGWLIRTGLSQLWNVREKRFAGESFRRALFYRSGRD